MINLHLFHYKLNYHLLEIKHWVISKVYFEGFCLFGEEFSSFLQLHRKSSTELI